MAHAHFTVAVGDFRGPLEVLLDLIEKRQLFVNDIPLAEVADDYIRYIQETPDVPLTETAQFVLVAATLLLIKSRSLLPRIALTSEEEEDIRDLEHRLALYARIRDAQRTLKKQWGHGYLRTTAHRREPIPTFAPASDITRNALHTTATQLIAALPSAQRTPTARVTRTINLDDVIASLHDRIQQACDDTFRTMTAHADRIETIVHFLALLELVKRESITAQQDVHFADIQLARRDTAHV